MITNRERREKKRYRNIILAQLILLVVVLSGASLYVYDYTQHNPRFCMSCHVMNDAVHTWETSVHKDVECHACHYATLFEKNKMFIKTLLERPLHISLRPHDTIIVPATMCIKCHWEGEKDVPKISNSTGHSRHWFRGKIECTACHAIESHKFDAEQSFCITCHADQVALPEKKKGMKCTDCHNFRAGDHSVTQTKCFECHSEKEYRPVIKNGSLRHTQFSCMECHKLHQAQIAPDSLCIDCHRLTLQRGGHPLHVKAAEGKCVLCHQPHQWKVSRRQARSLCRQCHKYKSLSKFNEG